MFKILLFSLVFMTQLYASKGRIWDDKSKGLVWGSLYGDAFGGPYEFLDVKPHPLITKNRALSNREWRELAKSVRLIDYKMKKSAYGAWIDYAPAGSITDDSRHKVIFWDSLINDKTNKELIAKSYIKYFKKSKAYSEWLGEYVRSAYFFISPSHRLALPKERLWGGIATQAGQMIYLMNALNFKGQPSKAYIDTYKMNIFDNGEALDFTSSVVAGLSHSLLDRSTWESTKISLKNIDPYMYSKVPFLKRKVLSSIKLAEKLVRLARGNPKKLFIMLEENLNAKTWWEADTSFTISYAFLEMAKDYPLASLALVRDFGHDTDSYAQVIGAFLGAIYGESLFKQKEINLIKSHIQNTHGDIFKEFE